MPRSFVVQYQPADSLYDDEGDVPVRAHWTTYFEDGKEGEARTGPLAFCLAPLGAVGAEVIA
jgi:hypothetical protein